MRSTTRLTRMTIAAGKENQSLYDHVIFIYDTIGYFQTYARIIENAFHERRAAETVPRTIRRTA